MSKAQKLNASKTIFLILSLALVIILGRLGFWQLDRAQQKKLLFAQWQQPVAEMRFDLAENMTYQKVVISGVLDKQRYFLLDNKIRNARVGYEVITFLNLEGNDTLLVNLGWVPGDYNRQKLPSIKIPEGNIELSGWLKKIETNFQLQGDIWQSGWPKRIQQIDFQKIAEIIAARDLKQLVLLSEKPQLAGNITDWKPVNMTESKHIGYAVQWFAMAFVLSLMMTWFFLKSVKSRSEVYEQK